AAAVPLARSFFVKERTAPGESRVRRDAIVLLATCAVTTVVLGGLATLTGRTWADFLRKIATEFPSDGHMINSASLEALLVTLGMLPDSPLDRLVPLVAFVPLVALFWPEPARGDDGAIARRALVLIAGLSWVMASWLNYYF